MDSLFADLPELDRQVQVMSRTNSPAEVFKVLREAARLAAPRGAVFTVRQGRLRGWSAFGYGADALRAQREWKGAPATSGWVAEVFGDRDRALVPREGPAEPDFGQQLADEAVGSAIRIAGQPIALLVLERAAGEEPWHPQALGLLVTVAQLRLELDLALRRLEESARESSPETAPPSREAATAGGAAPAEPPGSDSLATEIRAIEPTPEAPDAEDPGLEAAKRYARLVATDIRLYNEEAVVLGRRHGDLVRRLEEHLGRGKETFLRRHGDLGPTGLELLHDAYVQVLAGGDPKLIPPSLLG
jgi:hypothetical protein